MHDRRRLLPFTLLVFFVASLAVGCRNRATRDDPFLQRRLIPPPPPANYAPPGGGNYYPPGAPALQPVPGPQLGQSPTPAPSAGGTGAIRPASASGGSNDGWIRARDASTVPLDHSAAAGDADVGSATHSVASEPRRLAVQSDHAVRPLLAQGEIGDVAPGSTPRSTTFRANAEPEESSQPLQSADTPSSSSVTSLDWAAPRRP